MPIAHRPHTPVLIALYGEQGAGKSTTSRVLADLLRERGFTVEKVRLAEPLYELQGSVYKAAGLSMPASGLQDEELLAVLARQLRRLNPQALTRSATLRAVAVRELPASSPLALICEDARPQDREDLRLAGYRHVYVDAPKELLHGRRLRRGDTDPSMVTHTVALELGDYVVENDGSLADLRVRCLDLLQEILP